MQGKVIDEVHLLHGKLGSGSFGEIYQVQNIDTGKIYAIKIEKKRPQKNSRLLQEAHLYELLKSAQGVCKVYSSGQLPQYCYLMMEKLDYSLDELFSMWQPSALFSGKHFSKNTVFTIGTQIISRLETFHQTGYVHRDLKSGNFMIGPDYKSRMLYIIDFGLAKPYRQTLTGEHIARKGGKSMVGTAKFASIASHDGFGIGEANTEQCRRDDLESLAYMLIYFSKGTLPWQGIKEKIKAVKYSRIGDIKRSLTPEQLCEGVPGNKIVYKEQICQYLKAVRSIKFTEKPNYQMLRSIFPVNPKLGYDWEPLLEQKKQSFFRSEEQRSY